VHARFCRVARAAAAHQLADDFRAATAKYNANIANIAALPNPAFYDH
jgi:hypothetical protein